MKPAFTLIELLLTIAVIAILAALVIPASSQMSAYAARVKSISNLRQIGVASSLYANDHNQQLPAHMTAADPSGPAPDQWPTLFCAYLSPSDPRVFLDATDPATAQLLPAQIISNVVNNTAFIYNGFDDLGTNNQPPAMVSLITLTNPSQIVLMSQKVPGAPQFFVDVLFQPISDLLNLLKPGAFNNGSHYLFVDGSVRFVTKNEYSNSLWLNDKTITLPFLIFP